MNPRPSVKDIAIARRALPAEPVTWRPVTRGGQTAASRWVATLADGTSAFVKIAFTLDTAAWIRDEHLFYAQHRSLPFLPEMLGWHDDDEHPVLVLEDLSDASWPPPWDRARVDAVLTCLEEVHAADVGQELVPVNSRGLALFDGWQEIAADPEAFLSLGLCGAEWLEASWPTLHAAAIEAPIGGESLLHMDVRSDNLCLRDGRAVLVDWNWACVGNPDFEVAAWLPSLHAEGGPAPDELMPNAASFAALLSGFFAAHAGRPPIPEAPHVRPMQLMQARTALPWAQRALGLPPLR